MHNSNFGSTIELKKTYGFKAGKSGVSRMCVCHRRGVLSREEYPVPRHPGGVHGFYLLAEGLSDEP